MIETQRMIPLFNGKRTGIKLTNATWKAIELLAERRGKTWREWCAEVIDTAPQDVNITAVVRDEAIDQLMTETILSDERASDLELMASNLFTRNNGILDDETIKPYLAAAKGQSDFGGFSIIFGCDQDGADYLAVRNGLRGGVHFVMVSVEGSK